MDGAPLDGRAAVGPGEQSWRCEPASPWGAGRYAVIIEPRLEDLAGNSVSRVFDRDLTRAADTPGSAGRVALDFACVLDS